MRHLNPDVFYLTNFPSQDQRISKGSEGILFYLVYQLSLKIRIIFSVKSP